MSASVKETLERWNFYKTNYRNVIYFSIQRFHWTFSRLTQISQLLTEDEDMYWGVHWLGFKPQIMMKNSITHRAGTAGWVFFNIVSFLQFDGTLSALAMLALGRLDGEPFHNHSCSEFKIPVSSSSSRSSVSSWNPSPSDRTSCFTSWNTSILTWWKNLRLRQSCER